MQMAYGLETTGFGAAECTFIIRDTGNTGAKAMLMLKVVGNIPIVATDGTRVIGNNSVGSGRFAVSRI
jgi:hypothetical protein